MRHAAALLVLATPALAHADTGTSFDFGLVRSRVAVTDQTALDATSARFAIRIHPGRSEHFHVGAEADEGSLSGTTTLPSGAVARTAPGTSETGGTTTPGNESPLGGNSLSIKLFVGVHTDAGPVRLGAGAAAGIRDTWVSSDLGSDVAGRSNEPLFELRSRVDLRVSPRMLLGAAVSSDLIERRDISVALLLALDFTR